MNKAKTFVVAFIFTLPTTYIQADELRGSLSYVFSSVQFEDDYNNLLDIDTNIIGISGKYFSEESGPFVGLALGRQEVSAITLNGQTLLTPDSDVTVTAFSFGYRGGETGKPQAYGQAGITLMNSDDDSSNVINLALGIEQTYEQGRLDTALSYGNSKDSSTLGIGSTATLFLNENIGLQALFGASFGSAKMLDTDVDALSWHFGVGLEIRSK